MKELEKDNLNKYNQFLEEDKKIDVSNPCDPTNPDYPWVPCGINKDDIKHTK